jgi:hypothetical protein
VTTTQIILVVAIVTAIAVALLATQRSGPKVTVIETVRAEEEEEDRS